MSSKKTEPSAFSTRLRHALKDSKLSQQLLADKLATAQGTVSGWLNRGSMPRGDKLSKVAAALGVQEAWLAFGTESGTQARPPGLDHGAYSQEELLHLESGLKSWRNMIENLPPSATMQAIIGAVARWLEREQNPEAGSPLDIAGLDAVQICVDHLRRILALRTGNPVTSHPITKSQPLS